MAQRIWKEFTFEDGTKLIVRALSALEKKREIAKHGRIVSEGKN